MYLWSGAFIFLLASAHADTADYSAPATVSGVPTVTVQNAAQVMSQQLRSDVGAAVDSFSQAFAADSNDPKARETAESIQTLVRNVVRYPLNQSLGTSKTLSQEKLDSMAASIAKAMDNVEDVATEILSSTDGALRFQDLKHCLTAQGGLKDGQSCVTDNGMSISAVSDLMNTTLSSFHSVVPFSVLDRTSTALDPHFTPLLPSQSKLLAHVASAFESVQASVNGQLVQALDAAQVCFRRGMEEKNPAEAREAVKRCAEDPSEKNGVYGSLKTLALSIANQFVGYLTPNLLEDVHSIADEYLASRSGPGDDSTVEGFFRSAIHNSTLSIAASNAGNQVTYAYKLADCLDSSLSRSSPSLPSLTDAARSAAANSCLSSPDGPKASVREIVDGYIQQTYGVLPPLLASKLESLSVAKLDPSSPGYADAVAGLHREFEKTDVGPGYVTCFERFEQCVFEAMRRPGRTRDMCLLGEQCRRQPNGEANPVVGRRRS